MTIPIKPQISFC